jgi:hypothetical protein
LTYRMIIHNISPNIRYCIGVHGCFYRLCIKRNNAVLKYTKIAIAVSAAVLLNGCLEVEDNSNAEVVTALQQQNQILTEQAQILTEQAKKNTVSIRGEVVNLATDEPVAAANITVKVGTEVLVADVAAIDGSFKVDNLPADSDVEIIISSDTDEFMSRVFFYGTGPSTAGEAQKNFGIFPVSEAVEVSITVLSSADNSPVTGLEFQANSGLGYYSSASKQYFHLSTFDEVNGVYKIWLPKDIDLDATASLDTDKNGEPNYVLEDSPYSGQKSITLDSANLAQFDEIYLMTIEDAAPAQVEYRIAVVDELGAPIVGANIVVDDQYNQDVTSTYDVDTGQYVITAAFVDFTNIQIPAFTVDGADYQSAMITVNTQSDGRINIYHSGATNNTSYYIPSGSDPLDLVIQPRELVANVSELEVVLLSDINNTDSSMNIFYSQPVSIDAAEVALTDIDGITIIRGNASTDDLVLPGATVIKGGVDTPVSMTLSNNNTRLALTPESALVAGDTYNYAVANVDVLASDETVDIYSDSKLFTVPYPADLAFDINQVRLDNQNYTTNGTVITAQNTAGDVATASDAANNVYLIFPDSINSLQNFYMRKMIVVDDGVSRSDIHNYTIVDNGNVLPLNANVVTTANNESILIEQVNRQILLGTNVPDGQSIYYTYNYEYSHDNKAGSENSVSYEYSYETKAGEVVTGTVTLNVE